MRLNVFISGLFVTLFCGFTAFAQDGFETIADHAVIIDYETGIILYEKDARQPAYPASMTKIMTAEMVFNRIRSGDITMDTEFIVSENAWKKGGAASGGSTMFLKPGSSVRVEDLLRGVIIQSGNDACIVLAEGIAGSESGFADMMTRHAREIGLETATFRNSTGLHHPDHVISLFDLAKLAQRTISDYGEFYALYAERDFEWGGIKQGNRNPLLGRFEGADGLKTGYTEASGYGLVASAERAGIRRIVAFNGLDSKAERRNEGLRLMQAAFENFRLYSLYGADDTVTTAKVFMGKVDSVALKPSEPIAIGLARINRSNLKVQVEMPTEIAAPVTKGQEVGKVIITAPGMADKSVPLLAAEDIKRKSAFGRAGEALAGLFGG